MLIALITILILGGAGGLVADIKQTSKDLKTVMEKSDDRKAALDVLDRMEKLTKQRNKNYKQTRKQFLATISDHDYKIEDLDLIWAEYTATRSEFNNQFIELRFELKDHLSRENWTALFISD